MKFSIFICILTISLRGCVTQEGNEDVDKLINDFFKTTTTTSPNVDTTSSPTVATSTNIDTNCECVPYYLCDENRTIIENGENLIDIRGLFDEGPCESYLDTCCKLGNKLEPNEIITPSPPPERNPSSSSCGQRNIDGVSSLRITGANDNESQFGEFPWMVAVVRKQVLDGSSSLVSVYQCGGSLISTSVVLTAAHCVIGKTDLIVRVGEWDTQTKKEPLPLQSSAVRDMVVHEQYSSKTLHNDVALLLLETPVELAPNVGTICLPAQGENMDGRQCVVSGWGKDVFGKEGKYQVILKKVEIPTVPRGPCLEALRKTRLGSRFTLHESFICAGVKGKDACTGDGGSPLVCPSSTDSQVYVQAGIVAWGVGCGTETPGVYANVPLFRNWIDNKLSEYNIDPRLT